MSAQSAPQTPTPGESEIAAIDRLARAAQGLDSTILPDALWGPVMKLPRWWVVASPEGGQLNPSIGAIEGALALFAFTTKERAQLFIDSVIVPAGDDSPAVRAVAVPPAYLVDLWPIYAAVGANILVFNPNDVGFFCPLPQLADLWQRTHGASVDELFDEIPTPDLTDPA